MTSLPATASQRSSPVLAVAYAAIGAAAPGYLSGATASVVVSNSLVLMLISLGTMVVILTRNIDVSSGSVLGLSAAVLGLSLTCRRRPAARRRLLPSKPALSPAPSTGLMVAYLGIPSIVATLGTLGLYRGIMLVLTGGRWIEDLPQGLKALAANLGLRLLRRSPIVVLALVALDPDRAAQDALRPHISTQSAITGAAAHHLGVPVKLRAVHPPSSRRASAPPSPASSSPRRSASSPTRPAAASS